MKKSLILALLLSLFSCQQDSELGSRNNPVKLYFTPSVDAGTIATNSQDFIRFLEKETGLYFKTGIPTNYIAVVEAFGSERADIGVMNSFGYIMASEKYGAVAKLKVLRYGEPHYRGQILAHVDSGIKTIKDIHGKKFAFTDSSSTSGYMFPLKILRENKVEPSNTVFAMKHDNVVTMIYQKQVDAGATYYSPPAADGKIRDARARVKIRFPDVEEKIKIIDITDEIPNDPFVFRKGLSAKIADSFIAALKKYLLTDSGKKVFKDIYSVDGIVPATDNDYDVLRQMIKTIDLDPSKMVK
ncbi:MAG: phosphate/phosphite/phosphonate ABC transporter substrate-binding protein [Halobacteriovoraceae bacterium]|jgi:phosphonate transport system substrate-binding protein|nr:phosphate/phosphite/phosphonate ABC transporter substrate-binding protein [Halobacteriovoraceae bacterium]